MSRAEGKGFTRRQFVAGGAAGTAVVAGGVYGRFAIGDEFEEHVASVLGTSRDVGKRLTRVARERLGSPEYEARAAAFLAATTFPADALAPDRARGKAVRRLLASMIGDSNENLVFVGLVEPDAPKACNGLGRG